MTFLTLSTALIDTGKRDDLTHKSLHQDCAGSFFLCNIIAQLYNNWIVISGYRKGIKGIEFTSVALKIVLSIAIVAQIYISAVYSVENDNE